MQDNTAFPDPTALTPQQIETKTAEVGSAKVGMNPAKSFVLAVMAGFFVGVGAMFMTLVKPDATLTLAASSLLGGLSFSLGLFLVLVAGAELFTGNSLMLIGRMHGRYAWGDLAKSWLVVYVGNLAGALLLVALLVGAGFADMAGGGAGETLVAVAAGADVSALTAAGVLANISAATLGSIVGGAVFVALGYWFVYGRDE